MDEKVQKILEFMEGLTEAQRDLVYEHLGAWKYLEDIRREEETRTGKAVHSRQSPTAGTRLSPRAVSISV